jgi:hypothetical protein
MRHFPQIRNGFDCSIKFKMAHYDYTFLFIMEIRNYNPLNYFYALHAAVRASESNKMQLHRTDISTIFPHTKITQFFFPIIYLFVIHSRNCYLLRSSLPSH